MGVLLRDNGLEIRLMGLGFIRVRMEEAMKGFGWMICRMEMGYKNGMMEATTKVIL